MIWFHIAINLASAATLAHVLLSWRVGNRRHRAYARRSGVLLHALMHARTPATWHVLSRTFDANHAAWGEAIRKPWWRRDPIDVEET